MKTMIVSLIGLFVSIGAFATVDANTHVYLVAMNVNEEIFYIEKAPAIGCYGLAEGPALMQFTQDYLVPSNIGCGGVKTTENINALSCAKLDPQYAENADKISVLNLDISKCDYKNDPEFINTIKKAVKLNFRYSQPKLVIKI